MKRGSGDIEFSGKTWSRTVTLFWTLFLSIAVSILIAWMLPDDAISQFDNWDFGIWIYSFIIAFAIDTAIDRKNQLKENIELELNALRHLYHLVEQLGSKAWQTKIRNKIEDYHEKIATSFSAHVGATSSFRSVSHAIYEYNAKNDHENVILAEALGTVRQLSEIRERVHYELSSRIGWPQWLRLILSVGGLLVIVFTPKENVFQERICIALSIFVLLLPLDLLFHSNILSADRLKYFQERYRMNIHKAKERH